MSRDAGPQDVIRGDAQWCVVTGDCRDVLATLPAGGIDAVVTDPPYGVEAAKHGVTFRTSNVTQHRAYKPIVGDDAPFDPRPLLGIAPIVCLWGANHYADKLPSRARWLIWDKRDGTASNPLADCELAWTSDARPARLFSHRWMGMIRASEPGARWHPAQKPIRLLRWCMDTLEIPSGAVILDPYAGSGTTGVAAIQTGRRVILCEIEPTYADIARDRCERAAMQPRLIPDTPPPRVETLALDFEAVAQ